MYHFSLLLDAALKVMLRSFYGQPINSVPKINQIFECLWGGKPQKEKIPLCEMGHYFLGLLENLSSGETSSPMLFESCLGLGLV
jgi:hypothetical protein